MASRAAASKPTVNTPPLYSRAFAAILSSEKDRGITTAFRSSAHDKATRAGSPNRASVDELRTGLARPCMDHCVPSVE